ncbi:protein C1orf43 homolog isoform X2 [Hydra vulgaris]|uniref:Protein C1orf43 homolog isoform X2 n=1 Tax=Hydra vulgaris TaxID=6087 RepID=A0ABM4CZ31_HYDVU
MTIIAMALSAVSKPDEKLYNMLGGGKLLISVIFLGFAIVFIVLWAKRHILRLYLINNKDPVNRAGYCAPKELRKEIENNFNKIAEMRLEPKLLCDQGQYDLSYSSINNEKDDRSYKFRRKAFDLMSCLDELLSRVNISLARKPFQTVRQQLLLLQGPPYSPFDGYSELCELVTHLYEHARYGAKEFTEADYIKYSNGVDELYDRVHQKFPVPGSLVINCEHHDVKDSTLTSGIIEDSLSQVIAPSALVENKANSLRFRDNSRNQII